MAADDLTPGAGQHARVTGAAAGRRGEMLPPAPPAPRPLAVFGAVVDWTVVAIGATMITLVFVNVLLHVVHKDLAWVTELAELLMVWVTFLGGACATRRGAQMTITEFIDKLPGGVFRKSFVRQYAHALGVERGALLLDPARFGAPDDFGGLVARRMAHEPLAYIVGYRDFWTIRLAVGPGVLIPRPDSETLIEAAVQYFGAAGPKRILDLGTGPGTLLLAALAEWPAATGLGVDAGEAALTFARANADALNLADRAAFRTGDWADGVEGPFDLILCNPPYIADSEELMPDVAGFEPASALFAGADGLDDYSRIIPALPRLLAPGGAAILEIGHRQRISVSELAEAAGFAVACKQDLGGRDRALLLTRP